MADLPVFIPDHRARMLRRMLAQFRDLPDFKAILRAFAGVGQTLEDEIFGVLISTTFDVATGNDLDHWGALVGEVRDGLTDAEYRQIIQGRVQANAASGTRDELIRIVQTVTAPSVVTHADYPPASACITARRPEPMSDNYARRAGAVVRVAKPAGVALCLIEAAAGYFGFEGDPEAEPYDRGKFARLF